jgi:hypothetical protein
MECRGSSSPKILSPKNCRPVSGMTLDERDRLWGCPLVPGRNAILIEEDRTDGFGTVPSVLEKLCMAPPSAAIGRDGWEHWPAPNLAIGLEWYLALRLPRAWYGT